MAAMLGTEPIFAIHADLGPIMNLGRTPYGERRIVDVTGGTVRGAKLNGRILPGAPRHRNRNERAHSGQQRRLAAWFSIKQRAALKNRAAQVDELYATPLSSRVIAIKGA